MAFSHPHSTCTHSLAPHCSWHTLRLVSATPSGQRKSVGGDTWAAVLRDDAAQRRLPVRVFDDGDGGYTLAFVALAPGTYWLTLRLYYTSCW